VTGAPLGKSTPAFERPYRTEISLLERGARDPRLSTIARLAVALGKDSSELVAGIVPPDE
jgi:hypothetical protein